MIVRILQADFSGAKKIKRIALYLSKKRGASRSWNKRHQHVFELNPGYRKKTDSNTENTHATLWNFFSKRVNPETLRICTHISGTCDPGVVPENIYQADIEPSLNNSHTGHFLANKSLYNTWFDQNLFPGDYVHQIDGELLGRDLKTVSKSEILDQFDYLNFPVVMKPNVQSNGGKEVTFINSAGELIRQIEERDNFVVQEMIHQHPEMARYHPDSLNTVRVYVYRSVVTNEPVVLHAALRSGNGTRLDNVSAGGLVSMIREDGSLSEYAVNRLGRVYRQHPLTGQVFDGIIPKYEQLIEISKKISRKIFHIRVIGLDMCMDKDGNWRCIEVNTKSHSIRFSQYFGVPFFREYTQEVIDYCRENHWALKK
jgi:hypothetical protein